MTRFVSIAEAAAAFGYATGTAMRKAFERGNLPVECLLRAGPKTLRVDVERLAVWMRNQPAYGTPGNVTEGRP